MVTRIAGVRQVLTRSNEQLSQLWCRITALHERLAKGENVSQQLFTTCPASRIRYV